MGDSRAILCRNKTNFNLSEDMTPKNLKEFKRVEDSGAFIENNRVNGTLAVTRSFGDF